MEENNNITLLKATKDYIKALKHYEQQTKQYAQQIIDILALDEDTIITIEYDAITITTTSALAKRDIDQLNKVFSNYNITINHDNQIFIQAYIKDELIDGCDLD